MTVVEELSLSCGVCPNEYWNLFASKKKVEIIVQLKSRYSKKL